MDEDIARIPLRNRSGAVVAFALVDRQDEERVLAAGPWHLKKEGYITHSDRVDGHTVVTKLHRFILGLKIHDGLHSDHINRNKMDNRRSNLRAVTPQINHQNRASLPGSKSRYRGVIWRKNRQRWLAQAEITLHDGIRRNFYIGMFHSEDEAGAAARAWRLAHMPGAVD